MQYISPFLKSSGQIHKELAHIERYKVITVPKTKCKYFLSEEGCSDESCIYSHTKEEEFTQKKVPLIDIAEKIYALEYHHYVKIPRNDQVRGAPDRIMKHVVKNGRGKFPFRSSRIIFRCYGLIQESVSLDNMVFTDHRTSFRSIRLFSFETATQNFPQKRRGRRRQRQRSPKKPAFPNFYHHILSNMRVGEQSFFKVHPKLFHHTDLQRFKLTFPEEEEQTQQTQPPKKKGNYIPRRHHHGHRGRYYYEPKEELPPEKYAYFFFVVDEVYMFQDYMRQNFCGPRGYYRGIRFVDGKLKETQINRSEILKNFPPSKDEKGGGGGGGGKNEENRMIGLKSVANEYEKIMCFLKEHRIFKVCLVRPNHQRMKLEKERKQFFSSIRRRGGGGGGGEKQEDVVFVSKNHWEIEFQKRRGERKERLVKLNLRLANTYLLKRNYLMSNRYAQDAVRVAPYNIQASYYLAVGLRNLREWRRALRELKYIQRILIEGGRAVPEVTEKQKVEVKKELMIVRKNVGEKVWKEIMMGCEKHEKEKEELKIFEQNLKKNMEEQKGFYGDHAEEQREREDLEKEKRDVEGKKRKVWFGPNGEEFYEGFDEEDDQSMMRFVDIEKVEEKLKEENLSLKDFDDDDDDDEEEEGEKDEEEEGKEEVGEEKIT